MKNYKKIVALGLVLALVLSSMGNVFAYPINGNNANGYHIGDTFYPMKYVAEHSKDFRDTFGNALPENVVLDFNQKTGSLQKYYTDGAADRESVADYEAWATLNNRIVNPAFYMNDQGIKVPVAQPELTVVSAVANAAGTSIFVTFSNNSTATIQKQLIAGTHDYDFELNGKSYTAEDVTWNPPPPTQVKVDRVLFDNYRHFQVLFSGKVNLDSAKLAENYYFSINEGTADYGAVLPPSNQLDAMGAVIEANDVGNRTVVDIYLPEDGRFTNEADFLPQLLPEQVAEWIQQIPWREFWDGPYGFDDQAWLDDEQSIVVNMSNDVHGPQANFDVLTKGMEVEVGIRNIRDLNGQRTINTAVKTMVIEDEDRPEWLEVYQVDRHDSGILDPQKLNSGAVQELQVSTDNSKVIRMEFDEPVFNTHGLGMDDINNHGHYNVEVAVDDQKIASTNDQNLNGILKFYMDDVDSYTQACFVDLDIKAAIEKLYTDGYRATTHPYTIKITGITDLAGNETIPQVLEFDVSLYDPDGDDPAVIYPPEILDVVQIHDNAFRVYGNRGDISATFEIRNGDGDDGLIEYTLVTTAWHQVGIQNLWYQDVYVPSVDLEKSIGVNVKNDQLLAYDLQDTLKRTLRVFEVAAGTPVMAGDSYERMYDGSDPFFIKKDINSPIVEAPDMIEWEKIGSEIVLDVKDVVPNTWEEVGQPVYAMLYDYKVEQEWNNVPYGVFDRNSIDTLVTESYNMGGNADPNVFPGFDLLPVIVSYKVGNVTRTAVVSNRCLLEEFANFPGESGRHYGAPGSLTYDFATQKFTIDLTPGNNPAFWYNDLLTDDGKLVDGATYTIVIPDGYFADQARINAYNYVNDDYEGGAIDTTKAAWFVPADDVLYVSDERNNNSIVRDDRPYQYNTLIGDGSESFMVHGYKYVSDPLTQVVEAVPPVVKDPNDVVPQTSEELINWVEDRNEIWVEFTASFDMDTLTSSIDLTTLKNPANYVLDDRRLDTMGVTADDITFVVSEENEWTANGDPRQFAQIKLPYDTISVDGDYLFEVSGVANVDHATMNPVEVHLDIDENFRPIIEKAVVIGEHEIELTFNEPVRYTADPAIDPENLGVAAADNFVVYVDGNDYMPTTATVGTTPLNPNANPLPPYPLNKVVRLYLPSLDLLEDGLDIFVEVIKNVPNGDILMEDDNCNPLNHQDGKFEVQ